MNKHGERIPDAKYYRPIMLIVSGTLVIALLVLTGLIGYKNYDNYLKIAESLQKLEKAIETENDIVKAFVAVAPGHRNIRLAVSNVKKDHSESIEVFKEVGSHLEGLIEEYRLIFFILLSLCGVQIVLMLHYLFQYVHRNLRPVKEI